MQERVYQTAIRDVNDFKQRLLEMWATLDQRIIDNAVAQWRQRLQGCAQQQENILNILIFSSYCWFNSLNIRKV